MQEILYRLLRDEKGMSVVETLIITGVLGATAILGWSAVRGNVVSGGTAIGTKASTIVNTAGTASTW